MTLSVLCYRCYERYGRAMGVLWACDLGLAIAGEPLLLEQLFALRNGFSQSDLPMRVGIVQAGDLPEGWGISARPL